MGKNNRLRLTITLKKDLLPYLDQTIDGAKIRNRSHAIEYILSQNLGPKIKKVLILAGGEGTKMRPLTYELPKSMILVKDRPILEYIIESLRESELRDISILIGKLGDKIKAHFGGGSRFGVKISYIPENEASGTGGALRIAKKYFNEPFILIYGDILTHINFSDLIEFHKSHEGLVTVALTSIEDPSEYGTVRLHGSQVVDFIEKPQKGKSHSHLISAGIYVINPEAFKYIPSKGHSALEKDVLPKLIQEKKLYGYPFESKWFDVSTPKIYEKVIKEWKG